MPETNESQSTMLTALWTPGWYELDQSLVLGERQKYWFYQTPPEACLALADGFDLVFYNQLDSTQNCSVRYARIVEMTNPELGHLLHVDTDGLDYLFFPVDDEEIRVNAEEEPGTTYDSRWDVKDWSVIVKLVEVSEPVVNLV